MSEPPKTDFMGLIAGEVAQQRGANKLHPLILEAIDLLSKKWGAPSRELTRKAG